MLLKDGHIIIYDSNVTKLETATHSLTDLKHQIHIEQNHLTVSKSLKYDHKYRHVSKFIDKIDTLKFPISKQSNNSICFSPFAVR